MRILFILSALCLGAVYGQILTGTGAGTGGTGTGGTGTGGTGGAGGTGGTGGTGGAGGTGAGNTLPDQRCTLRCRANRPPQCALLNGVYRLFRSSCARRAHSCANRENWRTVNMSQCSRFVCPLACNNRRNTICATNGRNFRRFRNRCRFLNFACRSNQTWRPSTASNCATRIRIG